MSVSVFFEFCCSSPPSKPVAFEQFKEECGSEISRIFKENKSILLARKKRSSTVAQRINFIKREMEGIKKALEAQKQERWQQGKSLCGDWPATTWQKRGAAGFKAVLVVRPLDHHCRLPGQRGRLGFMP